MSHQQVFSYVGTRLPGLNQCFARINVSCSWTKLSDAGEARTQRPLGLESSTLPLSHCALCKVCTLKTFDIKSVVEYQTGRFSCGRLCSYTRTLSLASVQLRPPTMTLAASTAPLHLSWSKRCIRPVFFISWFTGKKIRFRDGGTGEKKVWKWPVNWSFLDLFFPELFIFIIFFNILIQKMVR